MLARRLPLRTKDGTRPPRLPPLLPLPGPAIHLASAVPTKSILHWPDVLQGWKTGQCKRASWYSMTCILVCFWHGVHDDTGSVTGQNMLSLPAQDSLVSTHMTGRTSSAGRRRSMRKRGHGAEYRLQQGHREVC